jgi:hypothetical protein
MLSAGRLLAKAASLKLADHAAVVADTELSERPDFDVGRKEPDRSSSISVKPLAILERLE